MLRSIPASSQLSLSMHPTLITALSEDNQEVDANVMLQSKTVRVQTIYHKEYVVAYGRLDFKKEKTTTKSCLFLRYFLCLH